MIGRLLLEDGSVFYGESFGSAEEIIGEVVFNTSMMGYQEILTDPSYKYQIVNMTYPLIGNYGVNTTDVESEKIQVAGFLAREYTDNYSNFRADSSLRDYLVKNKIPALQGLDTRKLTRKLRNQGAMMGIISFDERKTNEELLASLKSKPSMNGMDLVKNVTSAKTEVFEPVAPLKFQVAAYDYGIKKNILRNLTQRGCRVTLFPAETPSEKILETNPDGIFLSNGPGDPAAVTYAIENIKKLIGKKPIFGICLGHQITGLALGAKTYKLKFGHRGGNQPVKDLKSGKILITAENHGFAIDEKTLPKGVTPTHRNLNDQTLEGIEWNEKNLFSVQFHPESAPGPHDASYLFERFIENMEKGK
ncbi:MAG TPA: carbamoyl phosphate synthase small subunit [Spirochaetia bacterium]|nr:MAG: carbamoyl phosphate synthase small subunit [Spirochaetes bacterium GWB1_36_13]HCL56553.1 carbamoyl phosphate synthase small subunit [Spirochaetia bacterium]